MNVWAALKQLGKSRHKLFLWVSHAELQEHIKERTSSKFGAQVDIKWPRKEKNQRLLPPRTRLSHPI